MVLESQSNFVFIPPDGGWGWVILCAVFVCNFLVDGIIYSFGVFIFVLKAALEETVGHIAIIHAFTFAFYFIAGPVVCAFCNRHGMRPVAFLGGLLAGAGYGCSTMFDNLFYIIFTNGILAGIGLSMIYNSSNLVIGFYFEKWRSTATSLASCGSTLGVVTMPPLLAYVTKWYGLNIVYYTIACCMCLTSVLALTYMPLKPVRIISYKGVVFSEENMGTFNPRKLTQLKNRRHICCCPCSSIMNNLYFPTIDEISSSIGLSVQNFSYRISNPEVHRIESSNRGMRWVRRHVLRILSCYYFRKGTYSRPMYRDDIFYNNDLYRLPTYVMSTTNLSMSGEKLRLMYNMAVTRISTAEDFQKKRSAYSVPFVRAISTMLDVYPFQSSAFIIYLISGMLYLIGYIIPYTFLMERAVKGGMSENDSIWLISNIGVAITIGLIFNRGLSSFKKFKPLIYSTVIITAGGIYTLVSGFDYFLHGRAQFLYTFTFGFTCACLPLRVMISANLFQIEHLNNVCGLSSMTMGLAAFVTLVVSGALIDWLDRYDEVFYIAGGGYVLCAICLPIVAILRRFEKRRGVLYDDYY